MRHISIEGMDGVGKTTICEMLAEQLGYQFVEKPLHYLFDKDGQINEYQTITKEVNKSCNRTFTAWYHGLNNIYLYERFKNENIVTDRHVVSNYCWSGTEDNKDIYDLILKKIGKPYLTIILYANEKTILNRLKNRNIKDKDIKRVHLSEKVYERMIYFCEINDFDYYVVDTSNKTPEKIIEDIMFYIKEKEFAEY